jgi:hypothetical protein
LASDYDQQKKKKATSEEMAFILERYVIPIRLNM